MKEIIYNYDDLKVEDINNYVNRAKALIINSNDEILFGYADKTYQFIGGHVEPGEADMECLHREIMEEAGIDIKLDNISPFLAIKYYSKNYPNEGINTITTNNYFIIKGDFKPDISKRKLTDYETKWGYEYRYVHKDKALKELEKGLSLAKKKNPVLDTIEAVKEYLKITSDEPKKEEWE